MSDTNNTQATPGGGAAAPANNTQQPQQTQAQPAPRSDAEAALQAEEATRNANTQAPKPGDEQQPEKKPNRTRQYIERINGENRELRQRLQSIEARLPKQPDPKEKPMPKLEDFNFDHNAHAQAVADWNYDQRQSKSQEEQTETQRQDKIRETFSSYEKRVAEFADKHEDFFEAVGSIAYVSAPEVQIAIMAHEKGPEIAYYLANNDDEAFNMANVLPHNAEAAVARLVARMTAAQKTNDAPSGNGQGEPAKGNQQAPGQGDGAPAAQQAPTKPLSNAPPPAQTVSGRTPTETPPEKLTDDEWYERERQKKGGKK